MVAVLDLVKTGSLTLVARHLPRSDAAIRWVATSELWDPCPFLEGGEVLLTTGLEMARGARWRDYVERLVTRQVVALGFGVGLTHPTVPDELVDACRDAGLNLFEVPRNTTFVAISRTVATMLEAEAETAARGSLEAQRLLTHAALRQDVTALVARLADIVQGAAALVGRDAVDAHGPARDDLNLAAVHAEVERMRPQGLRSAASVQTAAGTLVVQPVGLTGAPTAYLAVHLPRRATDRERSAIATAVALLSLTAQSRTARRESDRRLRTRALELLLQADPHTASLVLAATTDSGPTLPERIVLARATGPEHALDEALAAMEADVPLAGRVHEELWLMDTPAAIDERSAALAGHGLLVGVGNPEGIERAKVSWTNAGHAMASATAATPVVTWERLVGEGALTVLDHTKAAAFAATFLQRLDDEHSVETLRSFLRHHGSRLKVAQELGIHRNTVANRITQIEQALGNSLDDPQVRVSAWIALQVATGAV